LNKIAPILISLIFTTIYSVSSAQAVPVNILPIESNPYGLPYEAHVQNFWKYLISLPTDKNPMKDEKGVNCANGQTNSNSSIFYLSGGGGGKFDRVCKVPSNKSVLIPVMTVEVSDKEVPNASVDSLHKIAKKDQDSVTSLYLNIDGKEYGTKDLIKFRTHTNVFDVLFPQNAVFGASPGKSKAVADGYYVITEILPKGKHEIHFKSSLICPGADCLEPNYAQDIKYTLLVE
jgi:hypothetical protein